MGCKIGHVSIFTLGHQAASGFLEGGATCRLVALIEVWAPSLIPLYLHYPDRCQAPGRSPHSDVSRATTARRLSCPSTDRCSRRDQVPASICKWAFES